MSLLHCFALWRDKSEMWDYRCIRIETINRMRCKTLFALRDRYDTPIANKIVPALPEAPTLYWCKNNVNIFICVLYVPATVMHRHSNYMNKNSQGTERSLFNETSSVIRLVEIWTTICQDVNLEEWWLLYKNISASVFVCWSFCMKFIKD